MLTDNLITFYIYIYINIYTHTHTHTNIYVCVYIYFFSQYINHINTEKMNTCCPNAQLSRKLVWDQKTYKKMVLTFPQS